MKQNCIRNCNRLYKFLCLRLIKPMWIQDKRYTLLHGKGGLNVIY